MPSESYSLEKLPLVSNTFKYYFILPSRHQQHDVSRETRNDNTAQCSADTCVTLPNINSKFLVVTMLRRRMANEG